MKAPDPFRNNPLLSPATSGPRRLPWVVSVLFHVLLVIGLLVLPGRFARDEAEPQNIDIVFYKPDAVPLEAPPPVVVEREPVTEPEAPPLPEPVVIAEVQPPPPPEPVVARHAPPPPTPAPKPLPRTAPPAAPVVERQVALALPRPEPREPRPAKVQVPKTGSFSEPAAEPRPARRPERVVAEVGSFGADAVEPPAADRQPNRVVAAGAFGGGVVELPREPEAPRRSVVTGNSFGAAAADERAPARRERAVATVAFDDSASEAATPARNDRSVNQGGFGAVENTTATTRGRSLPAEEPDSPVEIVSKPTPSYTEEARGLRIEGEVVLEVTFVDTGELRVLRVLDGLGHGLDEAAIAAAKKIQFTPARRDGRPVDHTATLRVIFRLA